MWIIAFISLAVIVFALAVIAGMVCRVVMTMLHDDEEHGWVTIQGTNTVVTQCE